MAAHLNADSSVNCITEKWIRKKLHLHKSCLNTIQSLVLPGSFSEKIAHLGRSLLGFTQLVHLDLSRNVLTSLKGLDHLKQLESLNIYYNRISSLNELFQLRHNSTLKELDVRLNPVTHIEPDYRLFLIHMLTELRKLDEHDVLDTERCAAIKHFTTSQAFFFDGMKVSRESGTGVQSSGIEETHYRSVMQDNTSELLELACSSPEIGMPRRTSLNRRRIDARVGLPGSQNRDKKEKEEHMAHINFTHESSLQDKISNFQQPSFDQLMEQLVKTVQLHVQTDVSRNKELKAELHELWYMTWRGLQKEVEYLRQKLDKTRAELLEKDLNPMDEEESLHEQLLPASNGTIQQPYSARELMKCVEKQVTAMTGLSKRVGQLEDVQSGQSDKNKKSVTAMLQESHQCLVETNHYLLRQLENVKGKHSSVVPQIQ